MSTYSARNATNPSDYPMGIDFMMDSIYLSNFPWLYIQYSDQISHHHSNYHQSSSPYRTVHPGESIYPNTVYCPAKDFSITRVLHSPSTVKLLIVRSTSFIPIVIQTERGEKMGMRGEKDAEWR